MRFFLELFISGVSIGALYGIVALGFVILFKSATILNFAHGQFLMLGAYLGMTLMVTADLSFVPALFAVAAIMAVFGALIHFGLVRWMVGAPLFSVVLLTIGISIVIQAGVLIAYGPTVHPGLTALPQGHVSISGITIGHVNLIIFGAALGFALLFFLFFRYTRLGLQTRALTENLEGAAAMGVNTNVIYAVAWASAALLAGSAGVFYSNSIAIIDLSLPAIGLRAFPAAIVGGLDSMKGALVGGLLVGVIEQLAVGYLGAEWQDVAAYGTMFVVLMVRPYGFFGSPEIVRV